MSITIYKDQSANAIFVEDANGVQFLNALQAYTDDPTATTLSVKDTAREIDIFTDVEYSDYVNDSGVSYGTDASDTINNLNAVLQSSGTGTGNLPDITSNLTISLVEGQTLNYELTADFGVGYEWDLSNVSGVTTVEGNVRKIIGGSGLSAGTYNIPVKAINYNGEDSETIVLTVSTPPFANTKSINFSNQDYLGANASLLDGELGRANNGSGSSDAWTISFWYKASNNTQGQTIFYFGDNDASNGGHIQLMQINNNGNKVLRFRYGSSNNRLTIQTSSGSLTPNTWQHVMITYDGGTTGSSSGSINAYYSRFKVFIDGSLQSTTNTNNNFGWSSGIDADNLRVGRFTSGNYMRDCRVDELAIWGSDQNGNISDIYNSGTPFDLTTLGTSPSHWWRMGDGDTFPNLQDSIGTATFVMYNMTSSDIVNDVP